MSDPTRPICPLIGLLYLFTASHTLDLCSILQPSLTFPIFFPRLTKYVRTYGDRANDLETVSKCRSSSHSDTGGRVAYRLERLDLRGKFSAIHREYSPNPRKFYAFCTSVTDTATTSGIIASGMFSTFISVQKVCVPQQFFFLLHQCAIWWSANIWSNLNCCSQTSLTYIQLSWRTLRSIKVTNSPQPYLDCQISWRHLHVLSSWQIWSYIAFICIYSSASCKDLEWTFTGFPSYRDAYMTRTHDAFYLQIYPTHDDIMNIHESYLTPPPDHAIYHRQLLDDSGTFSWRNYPLRIHAILFFFTSIHSSAICPGTAYCLHFVVRPKRNTWSTNRSL